MSPEVMNDLSFLSNILKHSLTSSILASLCQFFATTTFKKNMSTAYFLWKSMSTALQISSSSFFYFFANPKLCKMFLHCYIEI